MKKIFNVYIPIFLFAIIFVIFASIHFLLPLEWKIVVREDRIGEPHLLEIKPKIKHHIWNMKTIYDLSWQFYDKEPVSKKKFNSYSIGDSVRTRGELGE
jgi:hypothetical protein